MSKQHPGQVILPKHRVSPLLSVMAVALSYFLLGWLGLSWAVETGYSTGIWPPSGIGLAAVLLFGNRVWPGIFLGSVLVTLATQNGAHSPAMLLVVASGIATGAALQGVAGAILIRRYSGFPHTLSDPRKVLIFLLCGGPVSCVISASVASAILISTGTISAAEWLVSGITWWVGDTLGVLIFTPVVLIWGLGPRVLWRSRRAVVTLALGGVYVIAACAYIYARSLAEEHATLNLRAQARNLSTLVELSLNRHLDALGSLHGLSTAVADTTPEQFRAFTDVLQRYPALHALSWNQHFSHPARESVDAYLSSVYGPGHSVTERAPDGSIQAAAIRPEYVAVILIEPFAQNRQALGFDVYSNPIRRAALNRARDTGQPIATAPISLVQEMGDQPGVLVFWPRYRDGAPSATLQQRQQNIVGYHTAVFRTRDMMESLFSGAPPEGFYVELRDLDAAPSRQLLYSNLRAYRNGLTGSGERRAQPTTVQWMHPFELAGRVWQLRIAVTPAAFAAAMHLTDWLILAPSLVIGTLVAFLALVMSGRATVLEAEVTAKTTELQSIMDHSPAIMALKDANGRYMLVNREFERVFGVNNEDVSGLTSEAVLDPEVYPGILMHEDEVMRSGRASSVEDIFSVAGKPRNFFRTAFPILGSDAEILGVGVIINDVTEHRMFEEQLRQAQKVDAIGQLTGGVAHDFNNLLTTILGNTELLLSRTSGGERYLQETLNAAKRSAELTQRLLAFSRKQPLHAKSVDIVALLERVSGLLGRTLGETIDIELAAGAGLWRVKADTGQLENALLNLSINARDAMPSGGKLTIECTNVSLEEEYVVRNPETVAGDFVLISVTDEASGMSPQVRQKAFEPFFTTKEVGTGSGLGLSMIHGFTRQSGGHASIDSELGQGTTVKLYLPRDDGKDLSIVADDVEECEEALPGGGETVLVIEDEPSVRRITHTMLKELGYDVKEAKDIALARLVLSLDDSIDVILSDVVLPGGTSGPQYAEELQATHPGLKVVFMSGYSAQAASHNGLMDSEPILLNKPFQKAQLARALRSTLDA